MNYTQCVYHVCTVACLFLCHFAFEKEPACATTTKSKVLGSKRKAINIYFVIYQGFITIYKVYIRFLSPNVLTFLRNTHNFFMFYF